jgi:hypothetical protein
MKKKANLNSKQKEQEVSSIKDFVKNCLKADVVSKPTF